MEFPTLYHLGKNKALYSWRVWTEGDTIHSESGQVGGQMVPASKVATPKNVGRSNATTAEEQATKEAQAMHKHKLDRKYSLTPDEAREEEVAPMLAKKYKDCIKKVTWPVDQQPKLDGARALARWDDGRVILTSRGYQEWDVPQHINRELEAILPRNSVLDGELYVHGVPLQKLVNSWMKKRLPESATIEYHVYDMPAHDGEDSLAWSERKQNLFNFFEQNSGKLKMVHLVQTVTVEDHEEAMEQHERFKALGYEGSMVRMPSGLYTYGYRSGDLLKVKDFEDHEYRVIEVTTGKGKMADCAIFTCQMDDGQTFSVTAPGTMEEKREYLRNFEEYRGKLLTVTHIGYTQDGIPWHPTAKLFRPSEDLG